MANENRYYKTPFGESGDKAEVPDVSVAGAVGYDTGFGPDYELDQGQPNRKSIERNLYNGVLNGVTKNLKQWQEGLYPTWVEDDGTGAAFSYPQNMIVAHASQDWVSNEAANQDEPGTSGKWSVITGLLAKQVTTTELVAGTAIYAADVVVNTVGFTASGTGGAPWKQNGLTGPVSQTPAQIFTATGNGGLLNDGIGNQWAIVATDNEVAARALGVVGDLVADDTVACNAAGSTNYIINIAGLKMRILDKVVFNYLRGNTVTDSYFSAGTQFNLSATSILRLNKNDGSSILGGVGVRCAQLDSSDPADVIQYPYALDFEGITRVNIDKFRCSGAWLGVNALGNTGGAKIDTLEVGALSKGLHINGALDFWHATTLHFWPFGIAALTNLYTLYGENTIAARFGQVDGLDIKTLSTFKCKVITEAGSSAGPFGNIGALQLDGAYSRLDFSAGHLSLASLYSTSDVDNDRIVYCTGGVLNIATHDITPWTSAVSTTPAVWCDGGYNDDRWHMVYI